METKGKNEFKNSMFFESKTGSKNCVELEPFSWIFLMKKVSKNAFIFHLQNSIKTSPFYISHEHIGGRMFSSIF